MRLSTNGIRAKEQRGDQRTHHHRLTWGPTRLRIGLAQSKNVMAVRVLREVGLDDTRVYLTRFGFDIDEVPRSETSRRVA